MKLFKSRTFWTLVFSFVFNGFNAIQGSFSPEATLVINALLSSLAIHYKMNPSQNY